ncbi:MAG: hypothetical protein Q9176_003843 [Flavoplaca citrina]
MVLTRVLEPSGRTASVISPQDLGSKEGHCVRTKNFFYVFHPRFADLNDPAIEYIQETTLTRVREAHAGLHDLTKLMKEASGRISQLSNKRIDHGFSHLNKKLAAMEKELCLIEAVKDVILGP